MRSSWLVALVVFAASAASAAPPSDPVLVAKPPLSTAVGTLRDVTSPEASTRWRIEPVRLGNIFLSQILASANATSVQQYRWLKRSLTLTIYNPSSLQTASVQVTCGSGATLSPREAGAQNLAPLTFRIVPLDSSECQVVSDKPVVAKAHIEETVGFNFTGGYAGAVLDQRVTPWTTIRSDF